MIHKLQFSIDITADKAKIWKVLWSESGYSKWASVFFEGSYAVTDDWKEGSTVLFLSPDQSGIYSSIEKHIPNKIMMFKHIGNVLKGKKQPLDKETKKWSGATESYTVTEGINGNTLLVEIAILEEHLEFMTASFPKALEKIKDNCG